jgi:hypothetical protein
MVCCVGKKICALLILLNGSLIFVGLALLTIGIGILVDSAAIKSVINPAVDSSVVDYSYYLLLTLGLIMLACGIFGFIAQFTEKRQLLIIYAVFLVVLLTIHASYVIVMFLALPRIEANYVSRVETIVEELKAPNVTSDMIDVKCKTFNAISEVYKCCGATGPGDFVSSDIRNKCCFENYQDGCVTQIEDLLRGHFIKSYFVYNIFYCVIEFLAAIFVMVMIKNRKLGGQSSKVSSETSRGQSRSKVEPFENERNELAYMSQNPAAKGPQQPPLPGKPKLAFYS